MDPVPLLRVRDDFDVQTSNRQCTSSQVSRLGGRGRGFDTQFSGADWDYGVA